jgi:uncharacterized membrane protein
MTDLERWQNALAAEHVAVWGFGLVAAADAVATPAQRALTTHRGRRTECVERVIALGGQPVAPAAAYDLPRPTGSASARELAAELEADCSVAYITLAGAAALDTRVVGADWLTSGAAAQWFWSDDVPALPGLG